jgi:hypothetical protein
MCYGVECFCGCVEFGGVDESYTILFHFILGGESLSLQEFGGSLMLVLPSKN